MRILVIGGSGLIGAHVVQVLRERGHGVTSLARTAAPGVDHTLDLGAATPDELRALLDGHDGVVHAGRSEEERSRPRPIHPALRGEMVEPIVRLFTAARAAGLTRGVVMGSYYTHFHRLHPEWRLPERHVYIRCRVEQAAEARAAAGPALPVAVIELPFVFGRAGDRLPNWAPPLARWARGRAPMLAPPGGTAAVSVRSVAETTADALERGSGEDLPVADENLAWRDMLARIAGAAGRPRPVRRLPGGLLRAATRLGGALQSLTGKESGVNASYAAGLLLAELFVEPPSGRELDTAIRETFMERNVTPDL
ncbi:NAD(P)H-binding protein [Dactylosporangium sp. NPDC049140]|uniref:NAD-dependent epimerase/dehydratase family protein n=1 Tax=Dactylosporangium sp. NPDC049140 TaxID=3155647 RepID=UPI003407024D